MNTMHGDDALADALSAVTALGTARDREQLMAVRDRMASQRLRVLVAGEAKRGKSTLVNALLGRAVLPAGVTPLTAVPTAVRYGDDPRTEVTLADGHEERHSLAALEDLVTERGNPGNRRGLQRVIAYVDAELDVLRHSAAELLDLELTVPDPGGRLARDRRFFFSTEAETGQTELLAGVIRRSLPGELGRPARQGASAPRGRRPGDQPNRPGQSRSSVPAGGGDTHARPRRRAALRRRHRAYVVGPAGRRRAEPGQRRRSRAEGTGNGRARGGAAAHARAARPGRGTSRWGGQAQNAWLIRPLWLKQRPNRAGCPSCFWVTAEPTRAGLCLSPHQVGLQPADHLGHNERLAMRLAATAGSGRADGLCPLFEHLCRLGVGGHSDGGKQRTSR